MKILGIGNAIVDVICKVEDKYLLDNKLTKSTMKLVDEVEFKKLLSTLKIESTVSGGSVANSIVGLSQLGNNTGFIGKVSDDDLGQKYEDGLIKDCRICFGGMAILNIEYINKIFDNTNYLNILISMIKCRHDRMCFERIISLLLTSDNKIKSINGDIHLDQKWGYTIENYFNKKEKDKLMYKVWVGRKGTTSPLIEKFTTNNQEIVKPLNNIFEMKNIILFFLVIIILFTF